MVAKTVLVVEDDPFLRIVAEEMFAAAGFEVESVQRVLVSTAQEAIRRALAWASIVTDTRLQAQLTQAQAADTKDKAKTSRDGAQRPCAMLGVISFSRSRPRARKPEKLLNSIIALVAPRGGQPPRPPPSSEAACLP
jgi:CheY-like chemotaxis protein